MRQVNYTANTLNQYTQRSYPGYVEVNGLANQADTLIVGGNSPTWQGNNFWQELGFDNSWRSINTNVAIWDISATATNYTGYGVLLPKNPETLTYDLDGNLTQDSQWSYTWNAENKLVHMQNSSGMSLDFVYDLQGRRISKVVTVNGTVTSYKKFYYDGWNIIGEVDSTTDIGINYNWGLDLSQSLQGAGGVGGLLSMTVSGSAADETYLYQYDGNGNVIGLVDASGNLAAEYEYGPFGETVAASGYVAGLNNFRFGGMYLNPETGSYDSHSRIYSSPLAMWLSKDPIDEQGGLNLYGYVGNNPLNYFDPFGYEKGAEALMRLTRNSKGMAGDMPMSPLSLLRIILGTPFSIISGDIVEKYDKPLVDEDQCNALITVNGVFNNKNQAADLLTANRKLAAFSGAQAFTAKNYTTYISDLIQIIGDEAGFIQISSIQLAKQINSIYSQFKNHCSCAKIQVVTHSQGAMVFERALPLIKQEARHITYVYTLGGETTVQENHGLAGVVNKWDINSVYQFDPVPIANYLPQRWVSYLWNGVPHSEHVQAKDPALFEHPWDPNYKPAMQSFLSAPFVPIK